MALLEITDLRTEIQLKNGVVHAVDGVTLHVEAGETLGVVGESGCGKTMTALTIMQLLPNGGRIAGGSIKLAGREITALKPEEMRKVRGDDIAMIFQDPLSSLNPTHTVGAQIAEAVLLHRDVSKQAAYDRAVEVLDLVGLPKAKERLYTGRVVPSDEALRIGLLNQVVPAAKLQSRFDKSLQDHLGGIRHCLGQRD